MGLGVPVTRCAPFGPFAAVIALAGSNEVRSTLGLVALSEQVLAMKAIRDSSGAAPHSHL
jgi:hypothetical protein